MKNLANCKPSEFLKQTVRIKRNVEKWLTDEDIEEIRSRVPDLADIPETLSKKEKGDLLIENNKKIKKQITKNFMDILEVLLDKKADETLGIIALCCFVEPEHVDDHEMDEYFGALADLLESDNVFRFFLSLARLGQTDISIVSKQ